MDQPVNVRATVHREHPIDPGYELIRAKDPVTIVIFGASGDLCKRKLVPALYNLRKAGYLPEKYAVVGFSRTPMTDEAFRESMRTLITEKPPANDPLFASLYYHAGSADNAESFKSLKQHLEQIEKDRGLPGNRLYYLSVSPDFFVPIVSNLASAGMIYDQREHTTHWSRVIVEKPIGRDLESARKLNGDLGSHLHESQIYRIDHFLGKETVQNLLCFRFGNSIYEPLFNQKFVDNVQITAAETLGMEGKRGAYYDTAGALRDMVQNHLLQLLCLTAMEPPSALDAQAIRDEKVKVLRALVPLSCEDAGKCTIRGQYGPGKNPDGTSAKGYLQEEGVDPKSTTESFVALRVGIDNWRWAGVPFYLRTGKRMAKRVTEIAIQFKAPPLNLFREMPVGYCLLPSNNSNQLIFRIQPQEGIRMSFACKQPGMRVVLEDVNMEFQYEEAFNQRSPEAYERLLLDALRGDPSLYTRSDEVEYAWRFITSIHESWAQMPASSIVTYPAFSDGPKEANKLIGDQKDTWRRLKDM